MATPGTRATDGDRNNTCQALDAALEDGQLSMAEHRARVSAATNATALGELQSLTCDLHSVTGAVGAVREGPQTLKIGDVKTTYVIVNGRPGGSLDLSVYVTDAANKSGYIDIAPDATVKAIYPPDY